MNKIISKVIEFWGSAPTLTVLGWMVTALSVVAAVAALIWIGKKLVEAFTPAPVAGAAAARVRPGSFTSYVRRFSTWAYGLQWEKNTKVAVRIVGVAVIIVVTYNIGRYILATDATLSSIIGKWMAYLIYIGILTAIVGALYFVGGKIKKGALLFGLSAILTLGGFLIPIKTGRTEFTPGFGGMQVAGKQIIPPAATNVPIIPEGVGIGSAIDCASTGVYVDPTYSPKGVQRGKVLVPTQWPETAALGACFNTPGTGLANLTLVIASDRDADGVGDTVEAVCTPWTAGGNWRCGGGWSLAYTNTLMLRWDKGTPSAGQLAFQVGTLIEYPHAAWEAALTSGAIVGPLIGAARELPTITPTPTQTSTPSPTPTATPSIPTSTPSPTSTVDPLG